MESKHIRPRLRKGKLHRSQNSAAFSARSIPNYVVFTRDRSRHLSTNAQTPYEDLSMHRMHKNFVPFLVIASERYHYENASMAFLGLPRLASISVWHPFSRLDEALIGSIPNWIALTIDPKVARKGIF